MEPLIYLNGIFVKKSEAKISVFDHGFLYGDGIFETLRAYQGKITFLSQHLDRLWKSAETLSLIIPHTPNQLGGILYQSLAVNHLEEAYLRLSITRGEGEPGLDPRLCPQPTVVIMAKHFPGHPPELYGQGIKAAVVSIRRNAPYTTDPSIKSCNFLNNILAMHQALKLGAREAIMLTIDGYVCEGSISNIFWLEDRVLKTPNIRCGLLAGVTRAAVIDSAHCLGIKVEEGFFPVEDLQRAEEIFVTNTSFEVMPVTLLNQQVIGQANVGKLPASCSMSIESIYSL